jgi:hypothetical protein|tara:strand:+ start:504 stop:1076 length:573 start_codon:yes stop_codon:yes gene_type:complete
MAHPLNKFLPGNKRKTEINRKSGVGSHPADVNPKYVSPVDREDRFFINDGDADLPAQVTFSKIAPLWGRIRSGTILSFPYEGSDSCNRDNKDKHPLIIYINYGRNRVCSFRDKYNMNGGHPFFTGISIKYVDMELAIALSRIITSKGSYLNHDVIKDIDKHIAYSAYRMYYHKGIDLNSVRKANITKLNY